MRLRTQRRPVRGLSRTDLASLVPAVVRRWVADDPTRSHRRVEGAVLVATARHRSPVPLLNDALVAAESRGGTILKFSGDRIVVHFSGTDDIRRAEATGADLPARYGASTGVASGAIDLFLTGCSHRELFVTGEPVNRALERESSHLDPQPRLAPAGRPSCRPAWPRDVPAAAYVPEPVRRRDSLATQINDASIGFLHLANLDGLIADAGDDCATRHLTDLVSRIQHSFAEHDVAFVASEVATGGPSIACTAAIAQRSSDAAERLIRSFRDITDYPSPIEIHAAVAHGRIASGFIGSGDTRTFVTMGDAVACASALTSYATASEILVTADVMGRTTVDDAEMTRIGSELVYRIRKTKHHNRGITNMLLNIGNLALDHDDFDGARHYFEQALAMSRHLGLLADEALALVHLARTALAMRDPERAMIRCDEALAIRRDLSDDAGAAEVLVLLGRARYADGDAASARTCWLRAMDIIRKLREPAERSSV
jgi:class 3 adenylate cyclase